MQTLRIFFVVLLPVALGQCSQENGDGTCREAVSDVQRMGFPWKTVDPFVFCAYHHDRYPAGTSSLGPAKSLLAGHAIGSDFGHPAGWSMYHGETVPGFPQHPHMGFETITIVTQGFVDHHDSLGCSGRFGSGDVQWMTAGKGVRHSEMFPLLNQSSSNELELFQIWLNLERSKKQAKPYFKMLWSSDLPLVGSTDGNGKKTTVRVIAGEYQGHTPPAPPPDSWASDKEAHLALWIVTLQSGAQWNLIPAAAPVRLRRRMYVYRGGVSAGGQLGGEVGVAAGEVAELDPSATIAVTAQSETSLLIMQGRPIGQPVAHQGPFVANTQQELGRAFEEYQRTGFGEWKWGADGPVLPGNTERFAKCGDEPAHKPT